jgi:glycosyltransferase involved in cell wall biosynthesis
MSRPTLSVVLPNYNHAAHLPRAVRSIAEQSRPPDEFWILDDASTDHSLQVIEQLAARYPMIRVVRNERNEGVNAANRRLFALASGDYLHPAAADDERYPDFFANAMTIAERYPQAGLIFGQLDVKNPAGLTIGEVTVQSWRETLYADPDRFLREYLDRELATHAVAGATIYRRDAFLSVGSYREELGPWADSFAFRAIGLRYGVAYAPQKWAIDYRYPGSYSQRTKDAPRRSLELITRAAAVMRSDPYRPYFPETHVRRWEKQFRRLIAWNEFLGPTTWPRPPFWKRNLARIPRIFPALKLLLGAQRSA